MRFYTRANTLTVLHRRNGIFVMCVFSKCNNNHESQSIVKPYTTPCYAMLCSLLIPCQTNAAHLSLLKFYSMIILCILYLVSAASFTFAFTSTHTHTHTEIQHVENIGFKAIPLVSTFLNATANNCNVISSIFLLFHSVCVCVCVWMGKNTAAEANSS